ncbi:CPBP family intramembrane glutamic endopeptidase [Lactiplantibacillus daowaiensis]|uniref:CPBP family intramembrane glutamic endopeptidase n=1 Tax=Lactiplantibacillus daowaiensis TaxID=2559918 RepID=A0ABW1RX54_9LACO|nr:type II CAAX endopeptidase family protein [Lactiplantibacillus daowaiensis]
MQIVDRGLSWLWRLGLMAMLALGVMLPPMLLQLINELVAQFYEWPWQLGLVLAYLATFVVVSYVAYRIYRHYTGNWHWPSLTKRDFWLVLGSYMVILMLESGFQLLNRLFYQQTETQNNAAIEALMTGSTLALWLQALSAVFLTPIMEELVFRGVLMNLFFKHDWLNVLLSGVVFGSLHTTNTLPSFLIYFTMGLILAGVYHWSGKLLAPMLLHFLINAGAMSVILTTMLT